MKRNVLIVVRFGGDVSCEWQDDEDDDDGDLQLPDVGEADADICNIHALASRELRWPPCEDDELDRYHEDFELTLQLLLLKMQRRHNLPGGHNVMLDLAFPSQFLQQLTIVWTFMHLCWHVVPVY